MFSRLFSTGRTKERMNEILMDSPSSRPSLSSSSVLIDPPAMKEILDAVSEEYFLGVIRQSLEKSGLRNDQIDYLAILHMKRSIHNHILEKLGVSPEKTTYLENYGHIQSNDPIISIYEGLKADKIKEGTLIVTAAAGTGYTWGSTVIRWGGRNCGEL